MHFWSTEKQIFTWKLGKTELFLFLIILSDKPRRLLFSFSLCNLCDRMTASVCDICVSILASFSEDEKGIIPRAIQELFQHISENHNINFRVKVSYIEVYEEELWDLLELETSVKDLHIWEDENGNTGRISALELRAFDFCCVHKLLFPSLEKRAYRWLILDEVTFSKYQFSLADLKQPSFEIPMNNINVPPEAASGGKVVLLLFLQIQHRNTIVHDYSVEWML